MEPHALAGYAHEVAKAQRDIATLEAIAQRSPQDLEKRVRLGYRQYHLASLTNRPQDFMAVEESIAAALRDFPPPEDICLLKANVDGRFHRLDGVKDALAMCPPLAGRAAGRAIQADVDFQEGRYEEARAKLSALVAEGKTWDNLARLAHWNSKLGDRGIADRLLQEAEDELTSKEMRSFAWLELQRGELALAQGLLDAARHHAERAATSFPGHFKNDEFMAKVAAADGQLERALSLLLGIADADHPRPERNQAIGELLNALGRRQEALPWLESALSTYMSSVERGEVHYLHHLADYCADAGAQPADAVKWARKDVVLRENFSTQSALAWALYRCGENAEGVKWVERALSSGARDGPLFATAVALYGAVGDAAKEARFRCAAKEINPLGETLYLHL
jgi:tetratricopeptide (TPR) repeat protein